jgi:hypothetical protein
MKKWVFLLAFFFTLAVSFQQASAVSLDLLPASQTVAIGDSPTVDLFVSGLTAGGPPSVDWFDIDIGFGDPGNTLTFDSLEFGPFLGDPSDSTQTTASFTLFAGFVGVAEDSLLAPAGLHALQPSEFSLATLTFIGSNVGSTTIVGDLYVLKDTAGNKLIHEFGPVGSAFVNVVPVHEPTTILLVGCGLIGLAAFSRKLRKG